LSVVVETVEKLANEIRQACKIRVKVGWIAENDPVPVITITMHDTSVKPVDQSGSKLLYDMRFQIDIWHTSPKQRDETLDAIVQHIEKNETKIRNNWFSARFDGIADVEEESLFRKIAMLSIKTIG